MQNSGEIIAHKLEQLAVLYRQGQVTEVMEKTLEKLFGYEAQICRDQLRGLQDDLLSFEKRYRMDSEAFFQSFQNGETDDNMDFTEWASVFQMMKREKHRLDLLTNN
jgi:hypothetical protein